MTFHSSLSARVLQACAARGTTLAKVGPARARGTLRHSAGHVKLLFSRLLGAAAGLHGHRQPLDLRDNREVIDRNGCVSTVADVEYAGALRVRLIATDDPQLVAPGGRVG